MQGRGRLGVVQHRRRDPPQPGQGLDQTRVGHHAGLDGHQRPGLARLEPQHDRTVAQPPRMQRQPPPRGGRNADRGAQLGLQTLPAQRQPHLLALPRQIGRGLPVLQRAAATGAEMGAGGVLPLGRGGQQGDVAGAPVAHLGLDDLTRQGQGHKHRAGGHPVALGAHMGNRQPFTHAASKQLSGVRATRPNLNEDERPAQMPFSRAPLQRR